MSKDQKLKNSQTLSYLLMGISAVMLIVGLVGVIEGASKSKRKSNTPLINQTVTQDVTEPEENEVDYSDYVVPKDQPRMIIIPDLNVYAPIQRVGVTPSNTIAAPTNINFAGWFVDSVLPGNEGLSIIDGHVTGKYAPGVFNRLNELKNGQQISIEYGDGSKKYFEVFESKKLKTENTSEYMLNLNENVVSQLNLVTCDGDFDESTQQYSHRLVVATKLLN